MFNLFNFVLCWCVLEKNCLFTHLFICFCAYYYDTLIHSENIKQVLAGDNVGHQTLIQQFRNCDQEPVTYAYWTRLRKNSSPGENSQYALIRFISPL